MKDFNYAPAPRTHLTHPHGVRVFQMVDQMFANIARAASERDIRFHCVPDPSICGVPGRQRDTSLVYRRQFPVGLVQVPLLECSIDLTLGHPERKAVRDVAQLKQHPSMVLELDQFTQAHYGSVYGGCGIQFNDLAKLVRTMVRVAGLHCVGSVQVAPASIAGNDRDRDLAVVTLVLKDELSDGAVYDYQITLTWNGPDRFQKLLFSSLSGQQA